MSSSFNVEVNASTGPPSHTERNCRGLGSLSQILLAVLALGGTSAGVADAFPRMSKLNRRLPPAIAVSSMQRKRRWQGRQETIDTSLVQGFHRRQDRAPTSGATRLDLFFNMRDENGKFIKKQKPRRTKPTAATLNELRSSGVSFPKEVQLGSSSAGDASLSLRYMTTEDLKALVPMCIEEFGSKESLNELNGNFRRRAFLPRWIADPKQIPDLWEGFSFEMLIFWTLRLKLLQGGNARRSGLKQPKDPVMLVLCEENTSSQRQTEPFRSPFVDENGSTVVGMVELSLQPPDADRNPPALPLPLWVKAALAKHTTLDGSLQGWVTNLLISDSCRGRGYSKILMAAAEGIAEHKWGCSSVYLHADADFRSGKIPQSLYEGLGYDLVIGSTRKGKGGSSKEDLSAKFSWMGVSGKELERFTAIRMVDGVPLLCYSKQL